MKTDKKAWVVMLQICRPVYTKWGAKLSPAVWSEVLRCVDRDDAITAASWISREKGKVKIMPDRFREVE